MDDRRADDSRAMLHELRVRQIALEMRNEELEEANRYLDEEKRRYARLFDNVPVGHITLNAKAKIIELNLAASDILLKPRGELLQTSFFLLLDKEDREVLFTHLRRVLNSNDAHLCNLKLAPRGGRVRYIQLRSQRDARDEATKICYGAIIDITQALMARRALTETKKLNESIVQSISEPLIVVDPRFRVFSVNAAFVKTFGIEEKDAVGKSLLEIQTGLNQDRELRKRLELLMTRKTEFLPIEISADIPGRGRRDLGIEAKTLGYSSNGNGNILMILNDLTEQRRNARKMQSLMRELEDINSQLSHYASVVSHDLRAPLQIADNYVRFLKEDLEGSLPEKQRDYLEGIEASLGLARNMINGLLTLSRIRDTEMTYKRVYLGPFLRKLVNQLSLRADVAVTMCPKWPAVTTEPLLLSQIATNLIDNAIKYNDSKRKEVTLTWRELPEDMIELAIRDNGPGVRPAQREKIFKAFTRLHSNNSVKGSGLGLSIVRTATGRLRGSITLESTVGEGSTFYVRIPRNLQEVNNG